jgi:hypothetical protein
VTISLAAMPPVRGAPAQVAGVEGGDHPPIDHVGVSELVRIRGVGWMTNGGGAQYAAVDQEPLFDVQEELEILETEGQLRQEHLEHLEGLVRLTGAA